jgi:gamma-glutamylcyclotransferase (GGCT)/AIG2-like uncharacterized protein YtfP
MTPHLFVYGTLLSGARHPMGARLAREARLLGDATIRGRLYDLGRYPGLVEAEDADGLVHGEVYTLNSPAASLLWLDLYEGISKDVARNDYERRERTVRLTSGGDMTAWVYLYRAPVRGLSPIADGRWTGRRA